MRDSRTIAGARTPPLGYRWRHGGSTIVQLGGPSLTLTNVQLTNAGNYNVIITNAASPGGIISVNAPLTVLVDTDGDRMPDIWVTANGFDPNDPSA